MKYSIEKRKHENLMVYQETCVSGLCLYIDTKLNSLIVGAGNGKVIIFDLMLGTVINSFVMEGPVRCIEKAWDHLFFGIQSGQLVIYHESQMLQEQVSDAKFKFSFKLQIISIKMITWNDERSVLILFAGGSLTLFDAFDGKIKKIIYEDIVYYPGYIQVTDNLVLVSFRDNNSTSLSVYDINDNWSCLWDKLRNGWITAFHAFSEKLYIAMDGIIECYNIKDMNLNWVSNRSSNKISSLASTYSVVLFGSDYVFALKENKFGPFVCNTFPCNCGKPFISQLDLDKHLNI